MKKVNIIYDFDGTLTQLPIPRYLILEKCNYKLGTTNEKFLEEFAKIKQEKNCNDVEAFYELFFNILNENGLKISEKDFLYGIEKIPYSKGLDNYFSAITNLMKENSIELNHYVLTSGIKHYVENTKYAKYFKDVFGSTFKVSNNIINGIDYYLTEEKKVEKLKLLQENPVTKSDITIYIGDGLTDYYAMKYIHDSGGKTIFVYQNTNDLDIYSELNKENIVDYLNIADYSESSDLYKTITEITMN